MTQPRSGSPTPALMVLIILVIAINLYLCRDLIHITYLDNLVSNEGDLVTLAKFYSLHPTAKWFPYWSAGLPIEHTYSPLVPALTALLATATHTPIPLTLHRLIVFFYCLGPVLWMLFMFQWTGSALRAFAVAVTYSLVSPIALLTPALRKDLVHWYHLRRLWDVVRYADIAHMTSLCFLALALIFLVLVFRVGSVVNICLATISIALAILADGFGLTAISLSSIALLVVEPRKTFGRSLRLLSLIAVLTYALVSPYLTPHLLQTIAVNAQRTEGDFRFTVAAPVGWLVLVSLAMAASWLLQRRGLIRFLPGWTILIVGAVCLAGFLHINLIPMPHRLELEGDVAVSFLIVELAAFLPSRLRYVTGGSAILLAVLQLVSDRSFAQTFLKPIEITNTPEFQDPQWISKNLPGQRSMVPGDADYWFDYFSDNPQLSASHTPFSPNYVQQFAVYTIYTDTDPRASILWLKAFGATSVLVPTATSLEPTRPYANPEKFEGSLSRIHEIGGDLTYAVPQRTPSLAHVTPAAALVAHQPLHGLDVTAVQVYVNALEDTRLPLANLTWLSTDQAAITGVASPGQVISVQETFYPGWVATSGDTSLPINPDGLGLIVIKPRQSGAFDIRLTYQGSIFRNQAIVVSLIVFFLLVCAMITSVLPARRGRTDYRQE